MRSPELFELLNTNVTTPSLRPEALPSVTVPVSLVINAALGLDIVSVVVPNLGNSSVLATISHRRPEIALEAISETNHSN